MFLSDFGTEIFDKFDLFLFLMFFLGIYYAFRSNDLCFESMMTLKALVLLALISYFYLLFYVSELIFIAGELIFYVRELSI